MSAYGHQMERDFSARSLSSAGGGSEMGSHYESGFYMTSFAATTIIGALITVGVLLITLLIALSVMLQACERKSSGVVEIPKIIEDYSNCNIFALHVELNDLEAVEVPPICKDFASRSIKAGQYERDLNFTMDIVENYFESIKPSHAGLDVVLMDADDLLPSSSHPIDLYRTIKFGHECLKDAKCPKHNLPLRLYIKLEASGWPIILLSRKPEKDRNVTTGQLTSAGYKEWVSLIMRSDEEMQMDNREYFSRRKEALHKEGLHITGLISSKMDAITGPFSGKRIFKLPNPIPYAPEYNSINANPQQ